MKEHHVPEFYQSPWAGTDGELNRHQLNRANARILRKPPGAFGYLEDYTAFAHPVPRGVHKNAFELATQKLDSDAARVRDKMLVGGKSSDVDHTVWAQFIWLMRVRAPERIALVRSEGARLVLDELEKDPAEYVGARNPGDPGTFVEWVRSRDPGFVENAGLYFVSEIVNDTEAHRLIAELPWTVLNLSGHDRTLLLGDRPILIIGDLRTPKVLLAVPLNPTKAFVATNDEGIQKWIQSSSPAEFLRLMNEESLNRAKEFVFSCDESNMDLISTMVERRTSGAA